MRTAPIGSALVFALVATALPAQQVEWWQGDLDGALEASADSKAGMVLLYCWEKGHPGCQAMFGGTMADDKVPPVLVEFVCMGADRSTDDGRELQRRFHVETVPTILLLDPEGLVVDVIAGYRSVDDFLAELARIRKGEGTVAALREASQKNPDDLEAQLAYVRKLRETGDKPGSRAVIEAMIAKDPKCKKAATAEAELLALTDDVFPPDSSPQSWDYEPLYAFLRKQKNKRVRFLGYRRLAEAAYQQEDLKGWAKFSERAWKSVPSEEVQAFGQAYATRACKHGKELDKINKGILKLALKISDKAFAEVKKKQKKAPDKPYLAWAMYLHAGVLKAAGRRKDAFKLLDEAIATDPNNPDYKKAREWWLQGN